MNRYLLKTDISGIQGFIFDTTSKQAAKNLKGRSFYVYALTHLIEAYFSNYFETEEIVYNGGGNLLLYLIGEESDLKKRIKELQNEFLKEPLYPYITFVEAENDDFASHNKMINEKITFSKLNKQFLSTPFVWQNDLDCDNLVKTLRGASGFKIEKGNDCGEISKAGFSVIFTKEGENSKKSFSGNLLNKIPLEKDIPIDFDSIAKNALNRNVDEKIAALKMDVDNLGKLFIGRKKTDYTTLSSGFEKFFEETLYGDILNPYIEIGDVYPVFAGGDDCFLIGGWDVIFEIASHIQDKFADFQKNIRMGLKDKENEDITLSAGLIVVNAKYPVIRLAEEVEQALEISKRNGKNKITVFGEPLTWQEYKQSQEMAFELKELIENGESRALLQRIKSSDIGYRSLQEKAIKSNTIRMPNVHRLKYYLRNAKTEESRKQLENIFQKYSEALIKDFMFAQKGKETSTSLTNPARFPIAARWAELLIKNKD